MKKFTIVTVAALLAVSLSVSAQDANRKRGDKKRAGSEMRMSAKDRTQRMAKQLNLSTDETVKVQALFEKNDAKRATQIAKNRELRDQQMQNRATRRKEMQELRAKNIAEKDAELEKIIGKEKMETYKNLRQQRINRKKETRKSFRNKFY